MLSVSVPSQRVETTTPGGPLMRPSAIETVSFIQAYTIATKLRAKHRGIGVRFPGGPRDFSITSTPSLGPTQPPIQGVPGVKQQGRKADHSPPSSAEVKNGRATPPFLHTS
jgi:hypothetical protein